MLYDFNNWSAEKLNAWSGKTWFEFDLFEQFIMNGGNWTKTPWTVWWKLRNNTTFDYIKLSYTITQVNT